MNAAELTAVIDKQRACRPRPPMPKQTHRDFGSLLDDIPEPIRYTPPRTQRVDGRWCYERGEGGLVPWTANEFARINSGGNWEIRVRGKWYDWRDSPYTFARRVTPDVGDDVLAHLKDSGSDAKFGAWSKFIATVGSRWQSVTFDSFRCEHEGQAEAVRSVQRFIAEWKSHTSANLLLVGPCGTGKDHLLLAGARELIEDRRIGAKYVRGVDISAGARAAMHHGEESQYASRLAAARLLILSDPISAGGPLTDFVADAVMRIVDERWSNERSTWVTLNARDGDEAKKKLGAPIYDRLRDNAVFVPCNWPSYRRPHGTNNQ